jgi:hypothetical protein
MKILLSQSNVFGPTINRIIVILIGIALFAQAFIHLASRPIQYDLVFFLDLFVLLAGIWYFVLGVILLSSISKFAPRVEIEDTSVLIHNYPFGKTYLIDLNNVSKIKFGSFEITIVEYQGNYNTYRFNTRRASESLRIKEELRKKASLLKIDIEDEISTMVR